MRWLGRPEPRSSTVRNRTGVSHQDNSRPCSCPYSLKAWKERSPKFISNILHRSDLTASTRTSFARPSANGLSQDIEVAHKDAKHQCGDDMSSIAGAPGVVVPELEMKPDGRLVLQATLCVAARLLHNGPGVCPGHIFYPAFSPAKLDFFDVGLPGLEPGTSSLSEKRSNRLSYRPVRCSARWGGGRYQGYCTTRKGDS